MRDRGVVLPLAGFCRGLCVCVRYVVDVHVDRRIRGTVPVVAADRLCRFFDESSILHASELKTWLPWLMHEVLEKISERLIYSYVVVNPPSPKKVYRRVVCNL